MNVHVSWILLFISLYLLKRRLWIKLGAFSLFLLFERSKLSMDVFILTITYRILYNVSTRTYFSTFCQGALHRENMATTLVSNSLAFFLGRARMVELKHSVYTLKLALNERRPHSGITRANFPLGVRLLPTALLVRCPKWVFSRLSWFHSNVHSYQAIERRSSTH